MRLRNPGKGMRYRANLGAGITGRANKNARVWFLPLNSLPCEHNIVAGITRDQATAFPGCIGKLLPV